MNISGAYENENITFLPEMSDQVLENRAGNKKIYFLPTVPLSDNLIKDAGISDDPKLVFSSLKLFAKLHDYIYKHTDTKNMTIRNIERAKRELNLAESKAAAAAGDANSLMKGLVGPKRKSVFPEGAPKFEPAHVRPQRKGYVYKMGDKGLGYYKDDHGEPSAEEKEVNEMSKTLDAKTRRAKEEVNKAKDKLAKLQKQLGQYGLPKVFRAFSLKQAKEKGITAGNIEYIKNIYFENGSNFYINNHIYEIRKVEITNNGDLNPDKDGVYIININLSLLDTSPHQKSPTPKEHDCNDIAIELNRQFREILNINYDFLNTLKHKPVSQISKMFNNRNKEPKDDKDMDIINRSDLRSSVIERLRKDVDKKARMASRAPQTSDLIKVVEEHNAVLKSTILEQSVALRDERNNVQNIEREITVLRNEITTTPRTDGGLAEKETKLTNLNNQKSTSLKKIQEYEKKISDARQEEDIVEKYKARIDSRHVNFSGGANKKVTRRKARRKARRKTKKRH
tara:strand:+ start:6365 stop:7894 length:1530 start_codon:yes stop_codon:yes gene_type:complete